MIDDKIKNIEEYMSQIQMLDVFSETYRGGRTQSLYKPLKLPFIKQKWNDYIQNNVNPTIDFYIHIPFCLKICSYCNYFIAEVDKRESVENYVQYLCDYIDYIKDVFHNVELNSLFIGGGTPSILSPQLLEKLLQKINSSFLFKSGAEKTFEANPVSLTEKKIEVLAANHMNKVSMGVQSLNHQTLEKANREYQSLKIIITALENLKKHGIKDVNIDLLIGLDENEKKDFMHSLKVFSQLPLTCISTYWLTPTPEYLKKEFGGNLDLFYGNLHKQVDDIYNTLCSEIDSFDFTRYSMSKLSNHCWQFHVAEYTKMTGYTDIGDNSLLGIGPSARSYIHESIVYSHLEYIPSKFSPKLIDILGREIDMYDELFLELFVKIRDTGIIDTQAILNKYGIDLIVEYKEEFLFLLQKEYIHIQGKQIFFSDDMTQKYYSLLFFFSTEQIIQKLLLSSHSPQSDVIHISKGDLNVRIKYLDKLYKFIDFQGINIYNIGELTELLGIIDKVFKILTQDDIDTIKLYKLMKYVFEKGNLKYNIHFHN